MYKPKLVITEGLCELDMNKIREINFITYVPVFKQTPALTARNLTSINSLVVKSFTVFLLQSQSVTA